MYKHILHKLFIKLGYKVNLKQLSDNYGLNYQEISTIIYNGVMPYDCKKEAYKPSFVSMPRILDMKPEDLLSPYHKIRLENRKKVDKLASEFSAIFDGVGVDKLSMKLAERGEKYYDVSKYS